MIGFGSPNKSGKASSHGSPLGDDEISLVRKKLKWQNKPFEIPKTILDEWRKLVKMVNNKKKMARNYRKERLKDKG